MNWNELGRVKKFETNSPVPVQWMNWHMRKTQVALLQLGALMNDTKILGFDT